MKNYTKLIYLLICFISLSATSQVGLGTDAPQGALDITSTSSGVLLPRMTTTQRDAIASPVNAMLLFNTTNSSFEVYKSACSCWVSVVDGGTTPASTLINTAPTASNIFLSGQYLVGKPITVNYTYFDGQQDPEGLTTIQWQISSTSSGANPTNISGATTTTYTPVTLNQGNYIRAVINPRASRGVLNGVATTSNWILVEAATTPTANNLVVMGTPAQGNTLTASYIFDGGNGVEDLSPTGTSYVWQTASDALGNGLSNAPLYNGATSYTTTYIPQSNLLGRFIRVAARVKDMNGLQSAVSVLSPWVGPITTAVETAPVALAINYTPAPAVNLVLTGTYSYFDANNDPEGTSIYQWYLADDANGTNQTSISGATGTTFTVLPSHSNKFIGFSVKPIALSGNLTGVQSPVYYSTSSVLPLANFTFTGSAIRQLPFFTSNRLMNAQNTINVEINVSSVGGINFTTNTSSGYSFSSAYLASVTGLQWVSLVATGTQTTYVSTGTNFTITGVGLNTDTKNINITNYLKGSSFTTFSNGGTLNQTFNNNSTCQDAIISANHSTTTCNGSITVGSNSYNLVLINNQCWFTRNINEIPSVFPTQPSWISTPTAITDLGYWGYFNSTVTNGNAGWGSSELTSGSPAAGEGLLYQWSAAMNGTTYERSKGVCPEGWHIPSDCEWMYLEHGQGMALAQQEINNGLRNSTNEGNKLRSGSINSSNFSALLAGRRDAIGTFSFRGANSFFWTSSESSSAQANRRGIDNLNAGINRAPFNKEFAFSVRCLKD